MTRGAGSWYYFSNYSGNYRRGDRCHRLDGAVQVQHPNVGVQVARKLRVRVPHQALRHRQRHTGHGEACSERLSKCVQVNPLATIVNPIDDCTLSIGMEPFDQVGWDIEDGSAGLPPLDASAKHLDQLGSEGDEPLLLVLGGDRSQVDAGRGPVETEVRNSEQPRFIGSQSRCRQKLIQVRSVLSRESLRGPVGLSSGLERWTFGRDPGSAYQPMQFVWSHGSTGSARTGHFVELLQA
jgi:hypothetical protein